MLRPATPCTRPKHTKYVRVFSVAAVLRLCDPEDVIQQSGQVDPDFKKELQDLVQKLRPQLVSRG